MSQGTISNIIQVAKTKAEPAIKLIKDYFSKSSVVGFDESGCYCNGRLGLHKPLIIHWSFVLLPELKKFLKTNLE